MRSRTKWLASSVVAVFLLGGGAYASLPKSVDTAVRPAPKILDIVGSAAPKDDRDVAIRIDDGDGPIYMGPMTRAQAATYVDARPHIYEWGTSGYNRALAQVHADEAVATQAPAGFRITPDTAADRLKRASTFSLADVGFP